MSDYEVEVLVRGRPVKVFNHKGDSFVEGRKGSVFELKVTNNTWDRIEVVTSVDGLSVLDGEECGPESEGYLVPAKESIVIPGWKLPDNKAAQFVFEDSKSSYSSQVGKGTTNVGVIGLMVFVEQEVEKPVTPFTPQPYPVPIPTPWPTPWPTPRPWYDQRHWTAEDTGTPYIGSPTFVSSSLQENTAGSVNTSDSNNMDANVPIDLDVKGKGVVSSSIRSGHHGGSFGSVNDSILCNTNISQGFGTSQAAETTPEFEIGTGWGNEIDHNVSVVEFKRVDKFNPDEILAIFYDTKKGLEARGIEVIKTKKKRTKQLPNAFPTYSNGPSCEPPKGWKGKK